MNMVVPKPLRRSRDTVTLRRADWESLVEMLEDAEDVAAVAARRAQEATLGRDVARRDYLTGDELQRLLDWESPVRLWREKRGLSQRALAQAAGVSPSYLAEIETGRKPGSVEAIANLARALEVPMEHLVSSNRLQIAFQQLKGIVESRMHDADAVAEGQQVISALKAHGVRRSDLLELKGRLLTLAKEYAEPRTARSTAIIQILLR